MSAVRSLTGVNRISRQQPNSVAIGPTSDIGYEADRPNSNAAPVAIMRAEKAEISCPIA
jgi:hypothetical protein